MAKKIKKNRFAVVMQRIGELPEVRVDYIVECDDCGESMPKSMEMADLPPGKYTSYNEQLEYLRQLVATAENAELEE